MRRTLISLAILAAAAGSAFADDSRVVKSVELADLETLLEEEGYLIMNSTSDGEVSVQARDGEDGLIFHLTGTACEVEGYTGCLGINMQVRYDADGDETLERINDVNLMWAATSTWYSEGGVDGNTPTVGITRYVILDGGMTVRNIKDNLVNLLAIAPQAADYVWETGAYAPDDDY